MKQMRLSKAFAAKIATMALFLGMAQGVSAQQFTAKIPATNRFVKITSDGVNVRRLPNATSGKVMTWNSDGGSIDTYTKIYFSDTEGKLYRANSMTGAYVEPFHPAKNSYLPVAANQLDSQNGWYNVLVTAGEYAGNPGQANAKFAWVKGDFCKVVDVDRNADPLTSLTVPITKFWDGENDRMAYGQKIQFSHVYRRPDGIKVIAKADNENNMVSVCIPFIVNNYVLVARANVEVELRPNMKGVFSGALVKLENDMGDEELVFKAYVKSKDNMLGKAAQQIECAPSIILTKLLAVMCPNGVIPTDEVYFMGKDGKCYEISYNANVTGAGNAFQVKTLSFGK